MRWWSGEVVGWWSGLGGDKKLIAYKIMGGSIKRRIMMDEG